MKLLLKTTILLGLSCQLLVAQDLQSPNEYQGKPIVNQETSIDCRVILLTQGSFLLNEYVDSFKIGTSTLKPTNDRSGYKFSSQKKSKVFNYGSQYSAVKYNTETQIDYSFTVNSFVENFAGQAMIGKGSVVSVTLPDGRPQTTILETDSESIRLKVDARDSEIQAGYGELLEVQIGCDVLTPEDSVNAQRRLF